MVLANQADGWQVLVEGLDDPRVVKSGNLFLKTEARAVKFLGHLK